METVEDYETRLHKLRINAVGIGLYSTVYNHPTRKDVVVKLIDKDPAYMLYAKWAYANQGNPWVPKIYSINKVRMYHGERYCGTSTMEASPWNRRLGTFTLVFMERLKEYESLSCSKRDALDKQLINTIPAGDMRDYFASFAKFNFVSVTETKEFWLYLSRWSSDNHLRDVAKFIVRPRTSSDFDIHLGNLMVRNNRIVITDPLVPDCMPRHADY